MWKIVLVALQLGQPTCHRHQPCNFIVGPTASVLSDPFSDYDECRQTISDIDGFLQKRHLYAFCGHEEQQTAKAP